MKATKAPRHIVGDELETAPGMISRRYAARAAAGCVATPAAPSLRASASAILHAPRLSSGSATAAVDLSSQVRALVARSAPQLCRLTNDRTPNVPNSAVQSHPVATVARLPKAVREVEKLLRANGWILDRTVGSHRQFVHPDNPNVVTVPGTPGKQIATGTLSSIRRASGIKELR